MCFLQESYKWMEKFKFWNFWECPLYEIWEYASKGALSDSNNIFLWLVKEDIDKKGYFQNFSWFQIILQIILQGMHDYVH